MADELILVVEDEDMVRRQAEMALRKLGYRTMTAAGGNQALSIIRETRPDLMLSDIRMPDIDGLQLFAAARKIHPDIVVVLMTAHGSIDIVIKALQLGVAGFLQKPFTGSELDRAIQDALDKSKTVGEAIRLRLLTPLIEARRYLISELDLKGFCKSLVETTARETSSDYCAVFLSNLSTPQSGTNEATQIQTETNLQLEAVYYAPHAEIFAPGNFPATRLAYRAIQMKRTISMRRANNGDNFNPVNTVPGVVLAIPLVLNGGVLGVLMVGRAQVENVFSPGERELFEVLAAQLATILENLRLYQVLSEREERLRLFIGRFISIQEEERRQLANHLHDSVLPFLTSSRQHIQSYIQKVRPNSEDLLQAEKKLQSAAVATRNFMHELRPANLDEFGLTAALRQYVRELKEDKGSCNPVFRLIGPETPKLDSAVEIALFRAVQEAISNACKYTESKEVEVAVEVKTQRNKPVGLNIVVRDQGKGFDLKKIQTLDPTRQLGLLAMYERIHLIGGLCQIDSEPQKGTTVTISYDFPEDKI